MRVLIPIPMSTIPQTISARDPIDSENFFQNPTPMNDIQKVIIPIQRAGIRICVVLAVSDIQTARASILVATESVKREVSENISRDV